MLKARPSAGDLELGAGVRRHGRPDGVAGGRAGELRRRHPGHAQAGGRAHPGPERRAGAQAGRGRAARRRVLRPAAAAGARPGRRAAARSGPPCRRSRPWSTTATSAARTARASRLSYRFLRTLEHRIQLFNLRRTHVLPDNEDDLRRLGRSLGLRRSGRRAAEPSGGTPPSGSAGCTSGCSTHRCWTRWPGSRRSELRLTTDAAAGSAEGAGLRRPDGGAAAHRRAQPGRHPAGRDPAAAAAGDARLVRRRARTPITVCSRSGRCPTPWATRRGTCGRCATRGRWPSGWPGSSPPAGTRCSC